MSTFNKKKRGGGILSKVSKVVFSGKLWSIAIIAMMMMSVLGSFNQNVQSSQSNEVPQVQEQVQPEQPEACTPAYMRITLGAKKVLVGRVRTMVYQRITLTKLVRLDLVSDNKVVGMVWVAQRIQVRRMAVIYAPVVMRVPVYGWFDANACGLAKVRGA